MKATKRLSAGVVAEGKMHTPTAGLKDMRLISRVLGAVHAVEIFAGVVMGGFSALMYSSNPYLFDMMRWSFVSAGWGDDSAKEFGKIKRGMTMDEVVRINTLFLVGKREYSAGGELCRETYWDAGEDSGRKKMPVWKTAAQCVTDRVEWSLNMPGPYDKEYEEWLRCSGVVKL